MASDESIKRTIDDLLREVSAARAEMAKGDDARTSALGGLRTDVDKLERISADMGRNVVKLQSAFDALSVKIGRPGSSIDVGEEADRASARGLLESKHLLRVPKIDHEHP